MDVYFHLFVLCPVEEEGFVVYCGVYVNTMKKKITLLLAFSIILPASIFGQGETSNWYFGNNAGIRFNNNGTVTALDDGRLDTFEGCTTISDTLGNLLFYTDGIIVYDRNHNIMQNGHGLYGDPSSTQSALIIPKPQDPDIYYIFTVDTSISQVDPDFGLNYSTVDMTMNGGNGAITQKNVNLLNDCSEKIAAVVKDCSDKSIWVITLGSQNGNNGIFNTYHAFEVNVSGVTTNAVKSTFTSLKIEDPRGYLKFSNDGTKMASANMFFGLQLFDFEPSSGIVSNLQHLQINGISNKPYGIEFSPNNQFLYTDSSNLVDVESNHNISSLIQFDITAPNIDASQVEIDNRPIYRGALQLGPNGNIYRTISVNYFTGTPFLGVINNPNEKGTAANYQHNAIALSNNGTQGLPPFIQSFFNKIDLILNNTGTSIGSLDICEGDSFILEAKEIPGATYNWSKDGNSILNPDNHVFQIDNAEEIDSGRYTLEIILPDLSECSIIGEASINVNQIPANDEITLVQCDVDTENMNDGLAAFNLGKINIANENSYTFYESELDRNENRPITSLTNYHNTTPFNQTLYYTVTNSGNCKNFGTLKLVVNPNSIIKLPNNHLFTCDLDPNDDLLTGMFNLKEFKDISYPDKTISFYSTLEDVTIEQNQLPDNYHNGDGTIYARIENENGCEDVLSIQLTVNPAPVITLEDIYQICTDNPDLSIMAPAGFNSYQWFKLNDGSPESISANQDVTILSTGTYRLEVGYDYPNNGENTSCYNNTDFEVIPSNKAIFDNIEVIDFSENNSIYIEVSGDGDYEYSIDGLAFFDSNIFEQVPAGFATVQVRDKNGCGVVEREISVLGYPKFFTPNGDGFNDKWSLIGFSPQNQMNTSISIFDRYGKKVAEIGPDNHNWNGTYNSQPLPSSDYWFKVNLEDGRLVKGHFALKR